MDFKTRTALALTLDGIADGDERAAVADYIKQLELERNQAQVESADLRRQLDRKGYEYREVQKMLVGVGEAVAADDPTSPESILAAIAKLLKDLDELQREAIVMVKENGRFRYYIAELESHLSKAQRYVAVQAAGLKFSEAYPDVPEVQL